MKAVILAGRFYPAQGEDWTPSHEAAKQVLS